MHAVHAPVPSEMEVSGYNVYDEKFLAAFVRCEYLLLLIIYS